ncbi:hypothetical protein BASA81_012136 [Batrachochytrium salamandrivorans]|nr:hypothetical protein BASA81_012136 [Batrachochytrium salamandrivorans]
MFAKRWLSKGGRSVLVYAAEDKNGVIRTSTMWASMATLVSLAMIYKKKVLEPRQLAERAAAASSLGEYGNDLEDAPKRNLSQGFAAAGINYMFVPILMASALLMGATYLNAKGRVSELTRLGDQITIRTFDMLGRKTGAKLYAIQDMRIQEETLTEMVVAPLQDESKAFNPRYRFDVPCDEVKKLFQHQYGASSLTPNQPKLKIAPSVGSTSQEDTVQFEKSLLLHKRRKR